MLFSNNRKSSNDINDTVSNDEVVASDVPQRYMFHLIQFFFTKCRTRRHKRAEGNRRHFYGIESAREAPMRGRGMPMRGQGGPFFGFPPFPAYPPTGYLAYGGFSPRGGGKMARVARRRARGRPY